MLTINGVNYLLNEGSKVFNATDMKEVPVYLMKDGSHFFLARGEEEMIKVTLGLFIMHSEGMFHLPFEKWSMVSVGYLDDDVNNLALDNLYVMYPKEGIPYPKLEGFFYIPQFELNAINKFGEVYRTVRKSFYPGAGNDLVISGGYPIAKLDGVIGDQRKYVHRLLATVFNDPPKGYPNLQVDHNDGDKHNFSLDNLVWVTRTENINKAFYEQDLRTDNHPIDVFDMETKEILNYMAKAEFARAMGVDPWCISLVMQRKRSVWRNRYVIKSKEDARTFKEIINTPRLTIKGVKTRNVFTDEKGHYSSLAEAVRGTGVTKGNIRIAIVNENPRSVFNSLQFKMDSDETPWIDLNEYELECVRRNMRSDASAYELTNIITKEVVVLYGNDEVAKFTGANPRTVMVCARTGKRLLKKYALKKLTH